jgi:hypothetical protein
LRRRITKTHRSTLFLQKSVNLPSKRKKKVAYLFGAGATHAELVALNPDLVPETDGLLISNVSPRVIKEASADANYIRGLESVSATSGLLKNIELLISLIENAKMSDWDNKARRLKELVQADIENRAVAVSAYLFAEELHDQRKASDLKEFANFFVEFLDEVKRNLTLLAKYENPENRVVLEQFQKYISQASVEPYAIRRRHAFLKKAFDYYRSPRGKGKIIRDA